MVYVVRSSGIDSKAATRTMPLGLLPVSPHDKTEDVMVLERGITISL